MAFKLQSVSFLAVLLSAWAVIGAVRGGSAEYPIVAISGFVLTLVASIGLLAVWSLPINQTRGVFLATYAAVLFLVPAIWLVVSYLGLLAYSIVINACCEENWFLHVDLWSSLTKLSNGSLATAMWFGLMSYASLALINRFGTTSPLRWVAVVVSVITCVGMFGMMYLAFDEV